METADFLVIGGGIVGISIARELLRRFPGESVMVLEKERHLGEHASGRNSGVVHAGFYYTADSLKARFTRQGNVQLTEYCLENGLKIRRCGKLVVAVNPSELPSLDELHWRAQRNDVPVAMVSAAEAHEIEPRARTCERALWSPTTSSVDPEEVLGRLASDAERAGARIRRGVAYRGKAGGMVSTTEGPVSAGYVINAAGLHADRVARDFGFSERYRILPFKGVYLYGDANETLRTNIYPVPNLANPFLGVHFTLTVAGRSKIGPTAIPAFWREQYSGVGRFSLREFAEIVVRESMLFLRNDFGFRSLAITEVVKYRRRKLVKLASALVPTVDPARYTTWGRSGIRAQLLDIAERRLEMDFKVEGDSRSMHVLNAVSPAFTCALPFATHVVDMVASA